MAVKGAKGKAGRVVVWVILALLVVGLAGFGATNFGGSVRSVGSVGDTEIPVTTYARALQEELRALEQQAGRSFTLSEAQAFGIDRAVLQQVVAQAALDEEARRLGLSVGDEQVRQEIVAIPAFQGLDGTFDREAYEFALERGGLTVAEFEERVRAEAARALLQGAIAGGIATPAVYVDTLYGFARETRDFAWARLTADDLDAELPEPTEDELEAFHSANPDTFTLPEGRVFTYAWLTPDMLIDAIEVDDAALRDLYDERRDEFVRPERRLVERLVFATDEEAAAAAEAVAAGDTDFDTLVADRDLTLDDVDLGEVAREDLGAAADAVFALDEPGVAGPAPTSIGPAIFRVNAILAAQKTPFEAVRDELLAEYAADRAKRQIDGMIDDLDDRLAGGATLEDLADETDLELGRVTLRPGVSDPIAGYEAFREAAAAAEEGDFPEVRQLEDGGVFALRLDAVEPPRLQPYEEVRSEVLEAWRQEQTAARLAAQAETDAEALRGGASPKRSASTPARWRARCATASSTDCPTRRSRRSSGWRRARRASCATAATRCFCSCAMFAPPSPTPTRRGS